MKKILFLIGFLILFCAGFTQNMIAEDEVRTDKLQSKTGTLEIIADTVTINDSIWVLILYVDSNVYIDDTLFFRDKVGYIFHNGSDSMYIYTGGDLIITGSASPNADNSHDLGHPSFRWKEIYGYSITLTDSVVVEDDTLIGSDSMVAISEMVEIEDSINLYATYYGLDTLQESFYDTVTVYRDSINAIYDSLGVHRDSINNYSDSLADHRTILNQYITDSFEYIWFADTVDTIGTKYDLDTLQESVYDSCEVYRDSINNLDTGKLSTTGDVGYGNYTLDTVYADSVYLTHSLSLDKNIYLNNSTKMDGSEGVIWQNDTALIRTPGTNNIFIWDAGYPTCSGTDNIFIGTGAGRTVTSNTGNVAIGSQANYSSGNDSYSIAIGYLALNNRADTRTVGIGYKSGYNADDNYGSVFIGSEAGLGNTGGEWDGDRNVFIGYRAGFEVVDGAEKNVLLGYQAGYNIAGDSCVMIGNQAGYNETGSNALYIHNTSSTTPLLGGDFSTRLFEVGGYSKADSGFVWKPNSDLTVSNNDSIIVTNGYMRVVGNGGSVTGCGVNDGIHDGFVLEIQGTSDANKVRFDDGNNIELDGGNDVDLGQGDVLGLRWDSGGNTWYMRYTSDN